MKKCLTWFIIILFEALVIGAPGYAIAAPNSISTAASNTNRIINSIIRNTPGITTVTTTGTGAFVRAAGAVTASGLTIPVSASAFVASGRLAGMAARAVRAGSFVGIASVIIPWIADEAGIKVCPPPDFFCKAGPDVPVDPVTPLTGYYGTWPSGSVQIRAGTASGLCEKGDVLTNPAEKALHGPAKYVPFVQSGYVGQCRGSVDDFFYMNVRYGTPTCPDGTMTKTQPDGKVGCIKPGADKPATEGDIGTAVEGHLSHAQPDIQTLLNALQGANIGVFGPDDSVTVDAPPVVGPSTRSVTTAPAANGGTDTVTTDTQTKVTPAVAGGTLGNTSISYPTTTTTTTTTTNNITNMTSVTYNITNTTAASVPNSETGADGAGFPPSAPLVDPTKPEPTKPTEFPKDYNKEVTQLEVLKSLKGEGMPKAEESQAAADKAASDIDEQNAKNADATKGITADSLGLKSWMPTVPTAACKNPQVPNPMTGAMVDVNVCQYVEIFKVFISGVICFFCVIGSIRTVSNTMKV